MKLEKIHCEPFWSDTWGIMIFCDSSCVKDNFEKIIKQYYPDFCEYIVPETLMKNMNTFWDSVGYPKIRVGYSLEIIKNQKPQSSIEFIRWLIEENYESL